MPFDIAEGANYYGLIDPDLARRFQGEIWRVIDLVHANPEHYNPFYLHYRRKTATPSLTWSYSKSSKKCRQSTSSAFSWVSSTKTLGKIGSNSLSDVLNQDFDTEAILLRKA